MKCLMMTAAFAAAVALPALAQTECEMELQEVWAEVEASQLTDDQKGRVGTVLQQAYALAQIDDEAGCFDILEQVKLALGIGIQRPCRLCEWDASDGSRTVRRAL